MKTWVKIAIWPVVLLTLFGGIGIVVDAHLCGNEVADLGFYQKADICEEFCETDIQPKTINGIGISPKSCCSSFSAYGGISFPTLFDELSFDNLPLALHFSTGISVASHIEDGLDEILFDFRPPDKNIPHILQTEQFLI